MSSRIRERVPVHIAFRLVRLFDCESQARLDPRQARTIFDGMDWGSNRQSPFGAQVNDFWRRGVRFAKLAAVAFGLAVVAAIFLGAAVTDNAFVQILVTMFAALALWPPFIFVLSALDRLFTRRPKEVTAKVISSSADPVPASGAWRRLALAAPQHAERVQVLQRSLTNSRSTLGAAQLDPDANDLCILIDRRLPELIERELDTLAPDDRGRRQQLDELVGLVEQFARHCSRSRDGGSEAEREAAILRRRFEDRLNEF
jgi:hypothetical protein